jgi:hypothetical protein
VPSCAIVADTEQAFQIDLTEFRSVAIAEKQVIVGGNAGVWNVERVKRRLGGGGNRPRRPSPGGGAGNLENVGLAEVVLVDAECLERCARGHLVRVDGAGDVDGGAENGEHGREAGQPLGNLGHFNSFALSDMQCKIGMVQRKNKCALGLSAMQKDTNSRRTRAPELYRSQTAAS